MLAPRPLTARQVLGGMPLLCARALLALLLPRCAFTAEDAFITYRHAADIAAGQGLAPPSTIHAPTKTSGEP